MRDERFAVPDAAARHAQGQREQAMHELGALGDLAPARRWIGDAWGACTKPKSDNYATRRDLARALDATRDTLPAHFQTLGAVLVEVVRGRYPVDRLTRSAEMLLAHTLAEATAAAAPLGRGFDAAYAVVRKDAPGFVDDFAARFVAACAPAARPGWAETLAELPAEPAGYLEYKWDEETLFRLRSHEDNLREIGLLAMLWSRRIDPDVRLNPWVYGRLDALMALDSDSALQALERMPLHSLRQNAFAPLGVYQDRELLVRWLGSAARVADDNGRWTGHGMALLCAEAIVEHAGRLDWAVGQSRSESATARLRKEELPGWYETAFAALAARDDFRVLGMELAAELFRETGFVQGRAAWTLRSAALDVLVPGLAAAGIRVPDVQRAWQAGHDRAGRVQIEGVSLSPTPYLYLAAATAVLPETTGDELTAVWSWYCELLDARDRRLTGGVSRRGGHGSTTLPRLGALLARQDDPVAAWQTQWDRFFVQHTGKRFDPRQDGELPGPSIHLLHVGREAVASLPAGADVTQTLWDKVYRAGLQFVLGQPGSYSVSQDEAAAAFAYVPHAFGETWRRALDQAREVFVVRDDLCVESAGLLVLNGVPAPEVEAAFRDAGCDVTAAVKRRIRARSG